MTITYIEAVNKGFPLVQCHALGDGSTYESLVWDAGEAIPCQTALDEWIASNQNLTSRSVTKYEFRKLFTLNERIACDSAPTNQAIPAQIRVVILTIMKDLEVSGEVVLDNPDVISGVQFLEQNGIIGSGRAARILSNLPPL